MWELIETGRWWQPFWVDNAGVASPRKLLLFAADPAGDRFIELHRDTMFVYAAPVEINPDSPLDGAQWRRTVDDRELPEGTDSDVWAVLVAVAAEPMPAYVGPPSA